MFKKSYNRAVVRLRIETVTPLLIRAGDAGLDPTAAALTCVRTRHAKYGSTVYIPGSSLKGVLRSAAESSVRGQSFELKPDAARPTHVIPGACDPLAHETSCGRKRPDKDTPSAIVHRDHCLACRLFGSLAMKGRASVRDLFPWNDDVSSVENRRRANELEMRHGVAIDRIKGSVGHGPFEQEMVPAGVSFWGDIALENYQAWQLGFLAQAFEEVNEGFAQLGSTKSRGLGVARIEVFSILHEQKAMPERGPAGVGDLATDDERDAYGLLPEQALPPASSTLRGIARRFTVERDDTKGWMEAGLDALGGLR